MQMRYSPAIRELPPEERPRERLQKYGAESLSTVELLAIIIRTGTKKESAISLAERLLSAFKGLKGLYGASLEQIAQIEGLGMVKAVEIKAAIELGKRMFSFSQGDEIVQITCPQDVVNLFPDLPFQTQELFKAIFLDVKGKLIKEKTLFVGTLDASISHPREVFKEAVACSAASVIVLHNHPSGDCTPSRDDIEMTRRLKQAGDILSIPLQDHIIIGKGRFYSFRASRSDIWTSRANVAE
ncbi:DNA repair protein RadC [bacterium]|nr:DNA repair protein RadC [bacterium]